jgi:type II secretory pathway component PulC
MDAAMRIDVGKVLAQAAAPLSVLALLLVIIGGILASHRLDRVSRKPTALEIRALLTRVQGTLNSLQQQSADTSYPLEEAVRVIKAKQPQPVSVVATMAAPAMVTEQPRSAPPSPPEPALKVTGIISNAQRVLVCVNNRVLGVGGSVEGFKVVKIEKDQVTFDNQKGRIRIIKFK